MTRPNGFKIHKSTPKHITYEYATKSNIPPQKYGIARKLLYKDRSLQVEERGHNKREKGRTLKKTDEKNKRIRDSLFQIVILACQCPSISFIPTSERPRSAHILRKEEKGCRGAGGAGELSRSPLPCFTALAWRDHSSRSK